MDARIRKLQMELLTLGNGVIVVGIWSFLRSALTIFVSDNDYFQDVPEEAKTFVYIFIIIVTAILFSLDFYIGLSARSESKGKKKRIVYLVFTAISLVVYIAVALTGVITLIMRATTDGIISYIITIIIDITSIVCLAELMINGILLRKLRKNITPATSEVITEVGNER